MFGGGNKCIVQFSGWFLNKWKSKYESSLRDVLDLIRVTSEEGPREKLYADVSGHENQEHLQNASFDAGRFKVTI